MEGSAFSRGREGGLALRQTEGRSILQGQERKGVCFLQEKEKLGAGAGDQGGEGGVYSLGCGDSTGGQEEGCEGNRGWLEGGTMRGQGEDITLESKSKGGVFSAHTPEEEADKGLEREGSCPCMENGTEEGGGLLRDLSRHIN